MDLGESAFLPSCTLVTLRLREADHVHEMSRVMHLCYCSHLHRSIMPSLCSIKRPPPSTFPSLS